MATRTYGLSGSGMDIDSMVKNLMKAQRAKYDTMVQKKTQLEWKKADFNTMYTAVSDFRNTVFNYKLNNTLSPKQVSVSDETKVKATANADAGNLTHTIEVTSLAQGVSKSSNVPVDKKGITTGSSKDTLVNQFYGGTAPTPATFNIKISDSATTKEITVDTSKSIFDLVSSINNAGINVKSNYDATLDRFSVYTSNTGATSKISFAGSSPEGDAFLTGKLLLNKTDAQGADAVFKLDGVDLTQASNTFTISGVTYDLKSPGKTDLTIKPDNDKAITAVKSFVEAYNTLLKKVNDEISEAKYKDYKPLTTEQKKDMSESEVKAWEEKAKSGMLRREPILRSLVDSMRNNISNPVDGVAGIYNSMSAIGITTGSYTEGGKLYLNESKLKQALEADPDVVNKLFATKNDTDSSKQGVAVRLYDSLKVAMDQITSQAGITASTTSDTKSALAKQIRDYDSQMYKLNEKLADMENRYYKQFDAMETALNKLNQQGSWLSQQFSSK